MRRRATFRGRRPRPTEIIKMMMMMMITIISPLPSMYDHAVHTVNMRSAVTGACKSGRQLKQRQQKPQHRQRCYTGISSLRRGHGTHRQFGESVELRQTLLALARKHPVSERLGTRKALVHQSKQWAHYGCLLPGHVDLSPEPAAALCFKLWLGPQEHRTPQNTAHKM